MVEGDTTPGVLMLVLYLWSTGAMTYEQLLHEHDRLVDLLFVRGHLTGSEKRRLQRIRRRLDRRESKPPREASLPVEATALEPFFRLELDNDDGTLFEAVEAQTKEQAEGAFFAAVGMLLRYSKREKPK